MRRQARTVALKALYEIDCTGHKTEAVIDRMVTDTRLPEAGVTFARELVGGVLENKGEIDRIIENYATAWPVRQMPLVDRNILRLAIFEILLDNKVPVRAAINEAVELAKTFGGENSPKFVNGVLGSVSSLEHRQKNAEVESGNHSRETEEDSGGATRS
jgi:N utilization substance protein B